MVVNCTSVGDGGVLFPLTENAIHHAKGRVMYDRGKASGFMRPKTHNKAGQWEMTAVEDIDK
jgi:hypothetical protein